MVIVRATCLQKTMGEGGGKEPRMCVPFLAISLGGFLGSRLAPRKASVSQWHPSGGGPIFLGRTQECDQLPPARQAGSWHLWWHRGPTQMEVTFFGICLCYRCGRVCNGFPPVQPHPDLHQHRRRVHLLLHRRLLAPGRPVLR